MNKMNKHKNSEGFKEYVFRVGEMIRNILKAKINL